MPTCRLYNADCLVAMNEIPDNSVHLIAADLPYQSTACSWDTRIPLEALWSHYKRVLSPTGVIALNADMKLATSLIGSCPKGWYRYDLVWDKIIPTGYLDANRRPLRRHEFVLIFSPIGYPTYNPQMTVGKPYYKGKGKSADVYGKHIKENRLNTGTRLPTSILQITNANRSIKQHPTAKPQELTDWIIKTYSNTGDTVLDNTFGSGTAGMSALSLDRNFIGIELDTAYFNVAKSRIEALCNVEFI